jgi:selenide,water dikinase
MMLILFDAQTSGGLLISLPPKEGERLVRRMREEDIKEAAIVGHVVMEPKGKIRIT